MTRSPERAKSSAPGSGTLSAPRQISQFISKYEPSIARQVRAIRAALRRRLPSAVELVYDNYQFLALGFSATERTSDCVVSLAVSPKGVALCFYYGASLSDPTGILLGKGNQTRFIRLDGPESLALPAVEALLRAAIAQARTPLPANGKGRTVVRPVSAKQRPRRPGSKQRPRSSQRPRRRQAS